MGLFGAARRERIAKLRREIKKREKEVCALRDYAMDLIAAEYNSAARMADNAALITRQVAKRRALMLARVQACGVIDADDAGRELDEAV